ncbi:MAG TPA: ABC transporter permease [Stellaceae bacterium]|nr:ABC transporter permease [Stellaceae bacterium]
MSLAHPDAYEPASSLAARLTGAAETARALAADRSALAGMVIVTLLILAAAAAPLLAPYDPNAQDLALRLAPPGAAHWLGTDELGRDVLSRLLAGSRITLAVVALIALTVPAAGLAVGCLAGFAGGIVDAVLMRIADVFLAFPRLILALALVAAMGPGLSHALIAIALAAWPPYARLARAETMAIRERDFIAAARLSGASPARLLLLHIAPLCLPSLIVRASLDMAGVILTAAGLGFLGLGVAPPQAEWGAMIAAGRRFMLDQWWVAAAPGVAIAVATLGFNLLGEGLRDVLDPRQR